MMGNPGMQQCENCDRIIGRLEQAQEVNGHIVCSECYDRLTRVGKSVSTPVGPPKPTASRSASVVTETSRPYSSETPPIAYAIPPRNFRPKWVYAVAAAYIVLLLGFLSIPVIFYFSNSGSDAIRLFAVSAVTVAVFFIAGGLLIAVPVRSHWQLPNSQRAIWLPLIGSALLFAILCGAAALAAIELLEYKIDSDLPAFIIIFIVVLLWIGWIIFFWLVSRSLDPLSLSARLYKSLLLGSALELVIAVPMHLWVRRRPECCAGMGTGLAICLGALTALVAFGPGVFFLYTRRWNQVYRERSASKR